MPAILSRLEHYWVSCYIISNNAMTRKTVQKIFNGWTDGRTDGGTDGRTDQQTNGWTDQGKCGPTDGRTNRRTDQRTDGPTGGGDGDSLMVSQVVY